MQFTRLQQDFTHLISRLANDGYSHKYIKSLIKIREFILEKGKDGLNPEEIYTLYSKNLKSKRINKSLFKVLYDFNDGKETCRGGTVHYLEERSHYNNLNTEFKCLIDFYSKKLSLLELKQSTIQRNTYQLSHFLHYLQDHNITQIKDLKKYTVDRYFYDLKGKLIRGHSVLSSLKTSFGRISDNEFAKTVLALLPDIKYIHKNIPYFTDEELKQIYQKLHNYSVDISFRDRAIMLLLVFTGMRASDIRTLKYDDIDFEKKTIRHVQMKTGITVELPIIPDEVLLTITDYILHERPRDVDTQYIFLSSRIKSRNVLAAASISSIVSNSLIKLGVRAEVQGRKGAHLFRHNLAEKLMNAEASPTEISSVLGHSSPESLDTYLSSNIEQLRTCALDISVFCHDEEFCHE